VKLKEAANGSRWKLNLKFEFTARATPQQNSLAEVSLATIAKRGRAMKHRAYILGYQVPCVAQGLSNCNIVGWIGAHYT